MANLIASGTALYFSDTMPFFCMVIASMVSVSMMSAVIVCMGFFKAFFNWRYNAFSFKLGKHFRQYGRRDVQLMEQLIKVYPAFPGDDFYNSFLQGTLVFSAEFMEFVLSGSLDCLTESCMLLWAFFFVAICFHIMFFLHFICYFMEAPPFIAYNMWTDFDMSIYEGAFLIVFV